MTVPASSARLPDECILIFYSTDTNGHLGFVAYNWPAKVLVRFPFAQATLNVAPSLTAAALRKRLYDYFMRMYTYGREWYGQGTDLPLAMIAVNHSENCNSLQTLTAHCGFTLFEEWASLISWHDAHEVLATCYPKALDYVEREFRNLTPLLPAIADQAAERQALTFFKLYKPPVRAR